VGAVLKEIFLGKAELCADLFDGEHFGTLGYLDISQHISPFFITVAAILEPNL